MKLIPWRKARRTSKAVVLKNAAKGSRFLPHKLPIGPQAAYPRKAGAFVGHRYADGVTSAAWESFHAATDLNLT
jgi:hypothetical protein